MGVFEISEDVGEISFDVKVEDKGKIALCYLRWAVENIGQTSEVHDDAPFT